MKSLFPSAPCERIIVVDDVDSLKGLRLVRDAYLQKTRNQSLPFETYAYYFSSASIVDELIGTTAVDQTESILSEDTNDAHIS